MMRRCFVVLAIVVAAGRPLFADLKYSTHSELKPSTVTEAPPSNPIIAILGPQIVHQLLPNGSADTIYIISDKGTRTEYVKGGMNQQAEGTVILVLVNGDVIQLNTKDKTYWKTTTQALSGVLQAAGIQPEVTVNPTNEAAQIVGVRAQRSNFEVSIPLPIPEEMRAQLPPGFPSAVTMAGEIWYATAPFDRYVGINARLSQAMAGLGLGKLMQGGIVMRQLIRSSMFGGQELETVVTTIGEETSPADAFDVPADYKEVPSPIK